MDLDGLLIRIQGSLISLKRSKGLQKDPHDKNSNHSAFYQALEKIINTCKLSENDMRRIHLYLLLNSDFKFNEDVIEEENFSHIVSTAPSLDKFLLVETVLMLDFQKYVSETILFGHPTLSLEYLDIINTTLKNNKSVQFVPVVELVVSVIHRKLLSLSTETCIIEFELDRVKRKFSFYYRELLDIFSPPHDEYKMGYVVKSLLSLLCSCLDQDRDFSICAEDVHSLYLMSLPPMKEDCSSMTIIDLNKREDISLILSVFESNLNLVNLTTWMNWFEFGWESNHEDEVRRTMQAVVGEQAYHCKERLQNICDEFPEAAILSSVLANMAIKPYSEDEDIQKTQNLSEILLKVKEESMPMKSKKKWLTAMLKTPESFTKDGCFECVEEFGSYLNTSEEVLLFLERAAELINSELSYTEGSEKHSEPKSDKVQNIKKFVLKIFSQASLEEQGRIVGLFYEKNGLSELFVTKDFDKTSTEFFNKAVNTNERKETLISEFCALCLQSPKESLQRLLNMAIACNSQISFAMEVFKILSSICQLSLEEQSHNFVDKVTGGKMNLLCMEINYLMKRKHWNEIEKSNLVQLVINLHEWGILHQNDILHDCLYLSLKEFLQNSSWNTVELCLQTINELVTKSCFSPENNENVAILLAVLLLVLEKGRQEMRENFSVSAASTCELVVSYLPQILENWVNENFIEDRNMKWLKARVLCSSPLSQIYFSHLFGNTDGRNLCTDYQKFIMMTFFQNTEFDEAKLMELLNIHPTKLRYHLFKLLPSCTTSEWINIMHALKETMCQSETDQSLCIKNLIMTLSNVLLILVTVVSKIILPENKEAVHIIELYVKNFARIIKEEFWPCKEYVGLEKSCNVFHATVNLLESIPKEGKVQEACGFLVLNILSDIIQSVPHQNLKNPQNDEIVLQLATSISLISDIESKKCLARMLLENVQKCSNTVQNCAVEY